MKRIFITMMIFVFFIPAFSQDEIVFFTDSDTGDQFYDSSWGYVKAPSSLELAGNNEKFPVDALHPYQGAHSLRLHWTSKEGGDWGMAVASPGWPGYNFAEYDSIVYWINAPKAIVTQDLPDVALEDLSNNKSTKVWLGDYFDGVDEDSTTWQKIALPIDAFEAGPENADLSRIKTIFHFQKNADAVEHIAWLDEFRITKKGGGGTTVPVTPVDVTAEGHDSRIDLIWKANTETNLLGYYIYRSESLQGSFEKINPVAHKVNLYSDFLGENGKTYYYQITAVNQNYQESPPSEIVTASSFSMSDNELLSSIQKATFHYFWEYAHPVSGLARERLGSGEVCTSGGTGFGLLTIMVAAEREFVPRDSAAVRTLKILRFLQDVTPRYHGAWSHWINGTTGKTIPFSQFDNGGDLVETAYVVEALLAIRNYYTRNNPIENEIRTRCTQLWGDVEWDWYRRLPDSKKLYWHWSPNYNWQIGMTIEGWNETQIVYLLAIASPTHPVPPSLYDEGWAGRSNYVNGNSYYGYKQWVGWPLGGPLFFTHYSYLGFDPRNKADKYCNYYDNNRNITLINRAYCIENPDNHAGYGPLVWGLTASDDPWGYRAHDPNNDNGTITPTAAISAMPYAPSESIETLKNFYFTYGSRLWGEFGFKDAFNLDADWFAETYLAIDEGTIVPMIENYRTGLCWNMFMANAEIDTMLQKTSWIISDVQGKEASSPVHAFQLSQNYPNPFNGETAITFSLQKAENVSLVVFNTRGETVAEIISNRRMQAGWHNIHFRSDYLSSGVYFYRIIAGDFQQTMKMLYVK